MRSRRVLIHICWCRLSICSTVSHSLFDFWNTLNNTASQIFYENTFIRVLLQFKPVLYFLVLLQKIMNFFIVNFQITTPDKEFHVCTFFIYEAENMFKTIRDNTSEICVCRYTQHGMSFSTTCLTVGKYCPIVSFNNRFNQRKATLIVERLLLRINIIDSIISKIFGWYWFICIWFP